MAAKRSRHQLLLMRARRIAAREVQNLEKDIRAFQDRLAIAQQNLAKVDLRLKQVAGRVDPSQLKPLFGRYPFGALTKALLLALEGGELGTVEVAAKAEATLGLAFADGAARRRWIKNSVRDALKTLARKGRVHSRTSSVRPAGTGFYPVLWTLGPAPKSSRVERFEAKLAATGVQVVRNAEELG